MAALKRDLERVLPDQAHVLKSQLFGSQVFHPRQAPGRTRLTATLGARTSPAELHARVDAAVRVPPEHVHHLAGTLDDHGDPQRRRS